MRWSDFEGREPVEGRLVEGHVYFVEGLAPQDVYSIINPYPEHKFDARAIDLNWESVREGNFREIIIADANVSLGNEDALYRDPVFGGGSVVVSPASQWITDLNGDGIADTLWRDAATGAVTGHIQDVDGAVVATRSLGGDTDRVIAATGDFDGDRITDIVWHQESTGRTIVQTARSRGVIEYSSTADAASWSVIAAGDYDGDSRADLIWKNSQTGEHTLWLMDGLVATRRYHLGSDPDWSIVATAPDYDANGDGMTDLIWRNETTGETQLNRMAGGRTISTQDIGGDLDWAVVAAADFDADGRGDVLWRQSTTGALAREFPEAGSTAPPLNWAAVELADLDADGSPETVWWRTPLGVRAAAFASHAGSGVSSRIPDVTNWSLVRSPWLDDDGESA